MDVNVGRNNFRSPAALRKNELLSKKPTQEVIRNNISTARTSRRTRQERKAKNEQEKQNINTQAPKRITNKYEQNFSEHIFIDNQNELSCTYAAEMMEAEWPMPVPIPERFVQMMAEQHFHEFNNKVDHFNLRPDLEEETDWNIAEDNDSIVNKFPEPIERQSITNSQVFSMSETEFRNFNINNEIAEFIEVSNEEEFPPNYEDSYNNQQNYY